VQTSAFLNFIESTSSAEY